MPSGSSAQRHPLALGGRTALAVLGGYILCWGLIALCVSGTFALGGKFSDGEWLGWILALLCYPVAFLWAFAARSPWLPGVVLVGAGALMAAAASLLQAKLI